MKSYFISFLSSPCFLPSSLCGTEPFLHHPAPLATTHEPASTVGLRKLLQPIIPRDQPTHGSDQLTFSLPYRPSGTEPLPTNRVVNQLLLLPLVVLLLQLLLPLHVMLFVFLLLSFVILQRETSNGHFCARMRSKMHQGRAETPSPMIKIA